MCPKTFDYLIRQDVLAQKYYKDFIKVTAEKSILFYELHQADSVQKATSSILNVTKQEGALIQKSLDIMTIQRDGAEKQVKWLKFGCVAIGVTGLATTIYVAVKK